MTVRVSHLLSGLPLRPYWRSRRSRICPKRPMMSGGMKGEEMMWGGMKVRR